MFRESFRVSLVKSRTLKQRASVRKAMVENVGMHLCNLLLVYLVNPHMKHSSRT